MHMGTRLHGQVFCPATTPPCLHAGAPTRGARANAPQVGTAEESLRFLTTITPARPLNRTKWLLLTSSGPVVDRSLDHISGALVLGQTARTAAAATAGLRPTPTATNPTGLEMDSNKLFSFCPLLSDRVRDPLIAKTLGESHRSKMAWTDEMRRYVTSPISIKRGLEMAPTLLPAANNCPV